MSDDSAVTSSSAKPTDHVRTFVKTLKKVVKRLSSDLKKTEDLVIHDDDHDAIKMYKDQLERREARDIYNVSGKLFLSFRKEIASWNVDELRDRVENYEWKEDDAIQASGRRIIELLFVLYDKQDPESFRERYQGDLTKLVGQAAEIELRSRLKTL
jgi:hypothetical protein